MTLPYRKNVAVFILNNERKILACQRADIFSDWQLPQGGVDPGETREDALARELSEEVGLEEFKILAFLSEPISYEWPEELHSRGFKGQEQYFYAVEPAESSWKPNLNQHHLIEFQASKWLDIGEFVNIIGNTFRSDAYKTAAQRLEQLVPELFKRKF